MKKKILKTTYYIFIFKIKYFFGDKILFYINYFLKYFVPKKYIILLISFKSFSPKILILNYDLFNKLYFGEILFSNNFNFTGG